MTKEAAEYGDQLAQRLRRARTEAKMTRHVLAERVGVHRNTLFRWECGVVPKADDLQKLRQALREKGVKL